MSMFEISFNSWLDLSKVVAVIQNRDDATIFLQGTSKMLCSSGEATKILKELGVKNSY